MNSQVCARRERRGASDNIIFLELEVSMQENERPVENVILNPQTRYMNQAISPSLAKALRQSRELRDRFGLLSPVDLSALIGVDVRTLTIWRAQEDGPDWVRVGRTIFYRRKDVESWLGSARRTAAPPIESLFERLTSFAARRRSPS
jgi:hypothetical protein